MNIYSPINSIHQVTLRDQKRSRKIDTDIDMKPSSLSSTNHFTSHIKYTQPFFPVEKKMSIDLNDEAPKFNGCNCKNSQYLKRYCECFTRMKYCDPLICSCKNCSNTKGKEVMILYNIIYSQLYDEVSNFV